MYYIGLMSGTSMDAIDAALVEFDDKANLKFYREYPIENSLRHQIRLINEKSDLGHIADLDHELGHLFANAVNNLLEEAKIKPEDIIAIGSHGQTILHKPDATHKTSIQISDPNVICAETGITTVADFRRMDMAHGGQGAPLASAFHQYQFQQKKQIYCHPQYRWHSKYHITFK
jgi:anhydro-N-acetylmuramic acid kinase